MEKKTVGIIGGMGPMATVDLFGKLVEHTVAGSDAEHIHIIIDNYPQIPDRTKSILNGDRKVVPYLVESAMRLEKAGAELLVIPCNTSHYFYDLLCKEIHIPVLHMIRECAKKVKEMGYEKVALFATDGVVLSGIYTKTFEEYGINVLLPEPEEQKKVMHLIYEEVKAGKVPHPENLFCVMRRLEEKGAQAFVLGCTELPLAFQGVAGNFIDPTTVLAEATICEAGYEYK